jgi:hypothetical protein
LLLIDFISLPPGDPYMLTFLCTPQAPCQTKFTVAFI